MAPPPRPQRALELAIAAPIVRGYERYLDYVLALPNTVASPGPGCSWHRSPSVRDTPCVKVQGKLLSRWRTEAECGLAIRYDFLDRQIMLQALPDVFFLTDHYVNYPMILVRLEKASVTTLHDVADRGWRFVAPAKLIRQRDTAHPRPR